MIQFSPTSKTSKNMTFFGYGHKKFEEEEKTAAAAVEARKHNASHIPPFLMSCVATTWMIQQQVHIIFPNSFSAQPKFLFIYIHTNTDIPSTEHLAYPTTTIVLIPNAQVHHNMEPKLLPLLGFSSNRKISGEEADNDEEVEE